MKFNGVDFDTYLKDYPNDTEAQRELQFLKTR